jgi:hypothetical protein
VLPGESQEAYDCRLEKWMGELAPANDVQRFQVQRAVDLSFKLERGDAVEEALGLENIRAAENAGTAVEEEIRTLTEKLLERPGVALSELRQTSGGCRWLLSQWIILRQRLMANQRLYGTERTRVMKLVGKGRDDVLRNDPLAIQWLTALLGVSFGSEPDKAQFVAGEMGGAPPADMHSSEFMLRARELGAMVPSREQSFALLQSYFTEMIDELEQHLALLHEIEAEDHAIAVQRARIDLDAAGKQVLKYQGDHARWFETALRRLEAMQNPRQPRPPGRPRKNQDEKVAAVTPAAVTAETPAAVPSPLAVGGSGPERGEETTETLGAGASRHRVDGSEAADPPTTTDATTKTPAATTTEAKIESPAKTPAATTIEAKMEAPTKTPAATTTEAKIESPPKTPAATSIEAKIGTRAARETQALARTLEGSAPTRHSSMMAMLSLYEWADMTCDAPSPPSYRRHAPARPGRPPPGAPL